MADIQEQEYAHFLEETLSALVEMPIESLCIIGKMKGGDSFVNHYKLSVTDKILFAGLIKQDAMIDSLKANNLIKNEE